MNDVDTMELGAGLIQGTAKPDQMDIEHDAIGVDVGNVAKVGLIAADRLRGIIERIERLEADKREMSSDIKDIFTEAKSSGFDPKTLRQLLKIRKMEPAEVEEQESLLDVYRRALGM